MNIQEKERGQRIKNAVTWLSLTLGVGAVFAAIFFAPVSTMMDIKKGEAEEEGVQVSDSIAAAGEASWGLSFQQEGQPPVGNGSREELARLNAFYIGPDTGEKNIYLTFDAGYENGYTGQILDVLREKQVPAAFFLVGNYIEENPELVKRMEAEGHLVANHTMHHPDMWEIEDKEAFRKELKELEDTYREVTGKEMLRFYRPPQGKYSKENLQQAAELGYTTIFWSLAYVDWLENDQPTREEALNLLNSRIHPGAIVLLHSTSKTNSRILAELIDGWQKEGYQMKSITELGTGKF